MKKFYTISLALLLTTGVFAQSPERISYQAIMRDGNGTLVQNQSVGIRIQILMTSEAGPAVYIEEHPTSTNINGLVTLAIGGGNPVAGTFSGIDWGKGPYFIKIETDISGGTNYTVSGVSQILSVPYALHANTAAMTTPHFIGENYGGGIVFYVYGNGQHGLIASPADLSAGIRWYAGGDPGIYTGTAARSDGIGAGKTNSAIIIAVQGYGDGTTYAARICNEYLIPSGSIYGDWYLPSKFELNLMFINKSVINGITDNIYWSSTEDSNPNVWSQDFTNGAQIANIKNSTFRVRAIRAF